MLREFARVNRRAGTLLLVVVCGLPAGAAAQASVDEGWRRVLDADFEGAMAAFDAAEAGPLTRAELVRILEGRAFVHFARGDEDAVAAALVRLGAIAPEHRFAPETPPELRERFAELATSGALELIVDVQIRDDDARLEARATGDPGGLVRHVRVGARVDDDGEWVTAQDEPLRLPFDRARALFFYGEALGPGGAVLARDGSRETPRLRPGEGSGDDVPWGWIGLGVGAAVAVAVVVAIVVVVAQPADTTPTAPTFPP